MKTPIYTSFPLPRLIANQPHAIIAGATGSGKSTLLDSVLYEICAQPPEKAQVVIIDLKKISLSPWKRFPQVCLYADTPVQALTALQRASATMAARYESMLKSGARSFDGTQIYIIIDEAADLLDTCKQAQSEIIHLMRLGRAAGIHIIYATQSPDKKTICAQIQQNAPCLVGLRCRDAIASRQIIGCKGCEDLPRYGKAIIYTPELMRATLYDVPLREESEILQLADWWRAQIPTEQPKRKIINKWFFRGRQ